MLAMRLLLNFNSNYVNAAVENSEGFGFTETIQGTELKSIVQTNQELMKLGVNEL